MLKPGPGIADPRVVAKCLETPPLPLGRLTRIPSPYVCASARLATKSLNSTMSADAMVA